MCAPELSMTHLSHKKIFGDPESEENAKLGHHVENFLGFEGVVVPAKLDDDDEPWDVGREYVQGQTLGLSTIFSFCVLRIEQV